MIAEFVDDAALLVSLQKGPVYPARSGATVEGINSLASCGMAAATAGQSDTVIVPSVVTPNGDDSGDIVEAPTAAHGAVLPRRLRLASARVQWAEQVVELADDVWRFLARESSPGAFVDVPLNSGPMSLASEEAEADVSAAQQLGAESAPPLLDGSDRAMPSRAYERFSEASKSNEGVSRGVFGDSNRAPFRPEESVRGFQLRQPRPLVQQVAMVALKAENIHPGGGW